MFEKIFDFISKYEISKYDWFEYIRYLNNELVYLESFQEKDFFFYYLLYFYDKFIHYIYNSFWIKKDLSLWFDWSNQLILNYFLEPLVVFFSPIIPMMAFAPSLIRVFPKVWTIGLPKMLSNIEGSSLADLLCWGLLVSVFAESPCSSFILRNKIS